MKSQLQRALDISVQTGDKIIVVDELNDRSSVVMNLDDYEKLLHSENNSNYSVNNLTEEELLDKINHDIVGWKEANKDRAFLEELEDFDDDSDSFFDKTAADKDGELKNELGFGEDKNFEDDEIDADLLPDSIAPGSVAEEEKNIEAEAEDEEKKVLEENLYYYNEPAPETSPYAGTAEDKPVSEPENDNTDSGFTSIKDELKKNKKAWEIPAEVKRAAEDVKI